ncbi:MAG: hypothetical protein ACI857_002176 [Arenicella sp.]|jgi:hypothetical protein
MHKYILIVGLIFSSVSFGQLHSVGFHVGSMGTSLGSTFMNSDSKPKIDFTGGLNYQYRFTSHLTLGGNIEYTQYGAQIPIQFIDQQTGNIIAEEYSSWDWNYISVPLIVGYEMGGVISFKPKVGLVPSILGRAVYNFKSYEGTTLAPYKQSHYSESNKIDLAGMVGVDFTARFHSGVIFLAIDGRYSVTNLNNEFFNESLWGSMRNRSVSASLGVRFNLGSPEVEGIKDIIDAPED